VIGDPRVGHARLRFSDHRSQRVAARRPAGQPIDGDRHAEPQQAEHQWRRRHDRTEQSDNQARQEGNSEKNEHRSGIYGRIGSGLHAR